MNFSGLAVVMTADFHLPVTFHTKQIMSSEIDAKSIVLADDEADDVDKFDGKFFMTVGD